MRSNGIISNLTLFLIISTVALGCKYLQLNKEADTPKATLTPITKEGLKERMAKMGVESIPERVERREVKPNPLTLQIKFVAPGSPPKVLLNNEGGDLDVVVQKLKDIFKQREDYGVFKEGTNEVEKGVLLAASDPDIAYYNSKKIHIEDFEGLVGALREAEIYQIKLDTIGIARIPEISDLSGFPPSRVPRVVSGDGPRADDIVGDGGPLPASPPPPPPPPAARDLPKTVSGGVLNGKAIDLVKPAYPPAARAVRASGAVNVQVLVDEQGNVITASAVSGHPLLRSAATTAARASKFTPTMLGGKPVKVSGVVTFNFTLSE